MKPPFLGIIDETHDACQNDLCCKYAKQKVSLVGSKSCWTLRYVAIHFFLLCLHTSSSEPKPNPSEGGLQQTQNSEPSRPHSLCLLLGDSSYGTLTFSSLWKPPGLLGSQNLGHWKHSLTLSWCKHKPQQERCRKCLDLVWNKVCLMFPTHALVP